MVLWLETLAVSESLIDGRHLKEKIQEAVSLNSPKYLGAFTPCFRTFSTYKQRRQSLPSWRHRCKVVTTVHSPQESQID
jgi:hypothetical protein